MLKPKLVSGLGLAFVFGQVNTRRHTRTHQSTLGHTLSHALSLSHTQTHSLTRTRAQYQYTHPEGTGHADSPFDSFWFVNLVLPSTSRRVGLQGVRLVGCALVGSVAELRQRGHVPMLKRLNPRQRKQQRKKKMGGGAT